MEPSLQRFIDQAAIRDLHYRYCRGVDRMDFELVRSCFHPDAAIDQHGIFVGGVDDFIAWTKVGLPTFETTTHFTGNQLVEVDGDVARAEHYVNAFHRPFPKAGEPARDLMCHLRYLDRLERRGGEWRIADRVVVVDSERSAPPGDAWLGDLPPESRGKRGDLADRVYRL
ncbi:nuclear transport factor 2 family protein [Nocardioides immobilis]|uniref:Nuclear transport factor 2 family protein n=1 Tax=Nocardioides immobilis TaxID=2049295 RepID=A0A417Y0U0_9ACTN|nr:nuclear transport factor 2 family protein [Nocardioides immobilis]RHW26268.1 nuclear transport factor 2 family protein [Nocardioides immobilis]